MRENMCIIYKQTVCIIKGGLGKLTKPDDTVKDLLKGYRQYMYWQTFADLSGSDFETQAIKGENTFKLFKNSSLFLPSKVC